MTGSSSSLVSAGMRAGWTGAVVGGSLASVLGITLLQGHGAGALLFGLLIGQRPWAWKR